MEVRLFFLDGSSEVAKCDNWEIRGEWLLLVNKKAQSLIIETPESRVEWELHAAYKNIVGVEVVD